MAGSLIDRAAAYVADLVFPHVCAVCGRSLVAGEEVLCLHCRSALPQTHMHLMSPNPLEERLVGTVPVERAVAYCHYDRGSAYARLIQHAKYHGRPVIMRWLARRYAAGLHREGFFDGIDGILPVPMHFLKRMRRGFNQAEWVARGVQDATGLPMFDNLVAAHGHSSQTRRGGFGRWQNAQSLYKTVRPGDIDGLYLLIVDDVVTTGATVLACAAALRQASPTARLSVLAIASARMS